MHSYTPPPELWTFMTGTSEGHPPFTGRGAHVGTHQAKSFYTPAKAFETECAVEVGPSSRMGFCWSWGTPFWERKLVAEPLDYAVLLWSTTRIRGMVVANPQVPVMPWLEPKSSVTYPYPGGSYLAHSDMYQEMVLHMTLTGVSEFLFWHAGPPRCCFCGRLGACSSGKPCDAATCPDPPSNRTESIVVGVDVLNSVLAEADAVVGAAGRTPLILDAPQAWDPFVLSGVAMPAGWRMDGTTEPNATEQTRVYRFTPRNASAAKIVRKMPASFQLPGVMGTVVPVENGRLYQSPNPSSTAGFWIVVDTPAAAGHVPVGVAAAAALPGLKTDDGGLAPLTEAAEATRVEPGQRMIRLSGEPAGGAACLDGSDYAFYIVPGSTSAFSIGVHGGGWCGDEVECVERTKTSLGSSKAWNLTECWGSPGFNCYGTKDCVRSQAIQKIYDRTCFSEIDCGLVNPDDDLHAVLRWLVFHRPPRRHVASAELHAGPHVSRKAELRAHDRHPDPRLWLGKSQRCHALWRLGRRALYVSQARSPAGAPPQSQGGGHAGGRLLR